MSHVEVIQCAGSKLTVVGDSARVEDGGSSFIELSSSWANFSKQRDLLVQGDGSPNQDLADSLSEAWLACNLARRDRYAHYALFSSGACGAMLSSSLLPPTVLEFFSHTPLHILVANNQIFGAICLLTAVGCFAKCISIHLDMSNAVLDMK